MGDDRRDSETGQYTPKFTDEQLLHFIEDQEPVGTTVVADEFDCSQPAAYKRLKQLEEADRVTSKMIGGNRVWMSG